jgi:hypothetical protein
MSLVTVMGPERDLFRPPSNRQRSYERLSETPET